MTHLIFLIVHLMAILLFPLALFITIPMHLIAAKGDKKTE